MYMENRGQKPSLNVFYQLVTLLEISVDQFFFPDKLNGESTCRKQIDVMLNSMDEKELTVMKYTAEGLQKARENACWGSPQTRRTSGHFVQKSLLSAAQSYLSWALFSR